MKKMKLAITNTQIVLNQKQNQVLVKIAVCLILIGFTYRFYISSLIQISPVIVADDDPKLPSPPPPTTVVSLTPSDQFPANDTGIQLGWLVIFTILQWFSTNVSLEAASLFQVEEAIEVYHDEEYRSKRWFFGSYNFTLSVIWSPFLLKANIFEDNDGHSLGAIELHLDELDSVWVNEFSNFNYIMISGGKWFLKTAIYYEKNTIIGCHNCNKKNLTEIAFGHAYRKALRTTVGFITKPNHKVYTFLQTTTPDHFENGEWNTGGYCNRTGPFKYGEVNMRDVDVIMRDIELEEFENAKELMNGSGLRLLDTTRLSLLRPDGHPWPYRGFHPFEGKDRDVHVQNDCLHWCLPGPIDSWNDLMTSLLLHG
ncbi:hypothetical protein L1987_39278 [Smallanthus sonchifolius]|uniref:Uncharacterized protein n=1 Tax=Smallanthus sonchifolius TaxID=185202 RepID=A0ACB9HMX9_9ASTR|nr:hypothetical protein L1987_39278 [Smallanthus sonchifolius]